MRSGFLIGLGAGLASALLFYSAARGASPLLVILLGLLTPLPSLLAGLGWGWLPAAAAAAVGRARDRARHRRVASAAGYFLTLGVPAVARSPISPT